MAKTFERGMDIPHYKEQTEHLPVQELPQPTELIIPLKQHIGTLTGGWFQLVRGLRHGQKIGDSDAAISAPVHTGLSGTVREIGSRITMTGQLEDCVVIDVDPEQEPASYTADDVSQLSTEEIRRRIREAGIVGMGGAGFPTHVKVNPPTTIDYLILQWL